MTISLNPEEIRHLARQIEETIAGLTDINDILDATRDRMDTARRLQNRADAAKYVNALSAILFCSTWTVTSSHLLECDLHRMAANEILDVSKRVIEALLAAEEAQSRAESAIRQASLDIQNAQEDLTQVLTQAVLF